MKLTRPLLPLLIATTAALAQIVPDTLQTTLVQPPGSLALVNEGTAVAIDGTTAAVVSANDADPSTGRRKPAIRIYHAGTGALQRTLRPDLDLVEAVAVSGNLVAIGSSFENEVVVFDLTSPTPTVPVHTIDSSLIAGPSLALEGTILAVGDGGAAQVRIYDLASGTATTPILSIPSPTFGSSSAFGASLDLSGTRLVVGAPGTRITYVYNLTIGTPTTATLTHTLTMPPPSTSQNRYGEAVAVAGTRIIVGCRSTSTAGQAFYYDLASPTPATPIFACQNPDGSLTFGSAVALNAVGLVVGAPDAAGGGTEQGRAFGYSFTSNVPFVTYENPTPADGDRFGASVAASGLRGIIGAPFDDTVARDTGAAYAYLTTSSTPALPVATLSTASPDVANGLGSGVLFSNTHLVAAAPGKTASTGLRGEIAVFARSGASFSRIASIPGSPLALDGSRLIVRTATSIPEVLVHELASATPAIPTRVISPPVGGPQTGFGSAAALSGNRLALGCSAPPPDSPFQRVYVYDLGSPTPTQPTLVLRSPEDYFAYDAGNSSWTPKDAVFGMLLAMDGSRLAVGERQIASPSVPGRIHVFDLAALDPARPTVTLTAPVGTSWMPETTSLGQSYNTISMAGGTLLVTSNPSQNAHLFELDGATPTVPVAIFTDPGDAQFAWNGSISERRMVISGASGVRVYDRASSTPLTPVAIIPDALGLAACANGWLAVGLPKDDAAGLDQGAVKLYAHATPKAEITVELAGVLIPAGKVLDFGAVSSGAPTPAVITFRNTGTAALFISAFDRTGPSASRLAVTPGSTTIPIGGISTPTFTILPGTPGSLAATVTINDNAFDAVSLPILANALSYSTDTDGDGMSDASEIDLSALGFDWQAAQSTLTAAYNSGANNAGFYTQAQLQALKPATPLIAKNPTTGQFTLTLSILRSLNLQSFSAFPMAPVGASINPQGQIEYRFTTGDNAAFFRLEAQ